MSTVYLPYDLVKHVKPAPTTVIGAVEIVDDVAPMNLGTKKVMLCPEGSGFGFDDVETSRPWFMKVDESLDYEISFWFKQESPLASLKLGVDTFTKYEIPILTENIKTGVNDKWLINSGQQIISNADTWYFARYILYGCNEPLQPSTSPLISLAAGSNLRMKNNAKYLIVTLVCEYMSMKIFNFKVKPLKTKFSTGFIQSGNTLQIIRKNNNRKYSEQQLDEIAKNYLLPYNANTISIPL